VSDFGAQSPGKIDKALKNDYSGLLNNIGLRATDPLSS